MDVHLRFEIVLDASQPCVVVYKGDDVHFRYAVDSRNARTRREQLINVLFFLTCFTRNYLPDIHRSAALFDARPASKVEVERFVAEASMVLGAIYDATRKFIELVDLGEPKE